MNREKRRKNKVSMKNTLNPHTHKSVNLDLLTNIPFLPNEYYFAAITKTWSFINLIKHYTFLVFLLIVFIWVFCSTSQKNILFNIPVWYYNLCVHIYTWVPSVLKTISNFHFVYNLVILWIILILNDKFSIHFRSD